jgi:hypothetical protein
MNLFTHFMHLLGSGAAAYYSASQMRDRKTRPNVLAGFQLAESGSVPFLEALSQRAAKKAIHGWRKNLQNTHQMKIGTVKFLPMP